MKRSLRNTVALRMLRWRTPQQARDLGITLAQMHGDIEGACVAFQRAIDSGHPDTSPSAAWFAGAFVRDDTTDVERARAFFQVAIDSGHRNWAPRAALDLGWLLEMQGDLDGARRHYELAIDFNPPQSDGIWAHQAAIKLEIMLTQQGDTAAAARVHDRATDSGEFDKVQFAYNRAHELRKRGDIGGAVASYQVVIDSDPARAPTAAFTLGCVLKEHGDFDGARAAFHIAIDSGHPTAAPQAEALLRTMG